MTAKIILTPEQIDANIEAELQCKKVEQSIASMFTATYESYLTATSDNDRKALADSMVLCWNEYEKAGLKASIRNTFSKNSKALHKSLGINLDENSKPRGLVVKDGDLALAVTRKREEATDSELVAACKDWEKSATPEQIAAVLAIFKGAA